MGIMRISVLLIEVALWIEEDQKKAALKKKDKKD